MNETDSPLLVLIRQRMARHGLDRRALAERLAEGGNRAKAFRRVDELLGGERFAPDVIRRMAGALEIPESQVAVAREAHERMERERRRAKAERRRRVVERRRGVHLWGRLPAHYHPSLITVLGPEFYLLVPLPEWLDELSREERMAEVGTIARDHYDHHRRCRLVGYEYRRPGDSVAVRFDVDGREVGLVEADPAGGRSVVRVRGGQVETSRGVFRGGAMAE